MLPDGSQIKTSGNYYNILLALFRYYMLHINIFFNREQFSEFASMSMNQNNCLIIVHPLILRTVLLKSNDVTKH